MLRELKEILGTSINHMKSKYDKGHREEEFQVDDWVYLKLRPYRQHFVSQQALYKLGSRFYGPYKVLEKVGQVAYKMDLPTDAHIHPVVHVSQLKRRLGSNEATDDRLPATAADGRVIFRPAKALEYRQVKKSGHFRWEVLIEWKSLPISEAT